MNEWINQSNQSIIALIKEARKQTTKNVIQFCSEHYYYLIISYMDIGITASPFKVKFEEVQN